MPRFATRLRRTTLSLAFLVFAHPAHADSCDDTRIDLRGPWGQAAFSVEVADTIGERAKGLMHRASMPATHGMLFVYRRPQSISFWMKNTLIPLDMLFITADGRVAHIHENAIPLDETPIDGGRDIQYVLELNGGMARKLGLSVGTELRHPSINPTKSVWSCKE